MFLFGKKKKDNSSSYMNSVQPAKQEAPTTNSSSKIILSKAKDGLEKNLVRLKKEKNIDLSTHRARVFVVIDRSGSMYSLYHSGAVQEVLTRLLPLALKFDDNGELEVYVFNNSCTQLSSMNIKNFDKYVEEKIIAKNLGPSGGTSYAPVIEKTISDYNNNDESPYPAFGIFITDGENNDATATDTVIRKSSNYKIFYQFVGIGYENFQYLQKLDNLDGRKADNTAFIKVSDFSKLDDEQLYAKLLEQYPQWLKAMHIN